jgi:hypothetical protein
LTPWWPLFEMWEDKTEHVSTWDIFHSCWLIFFPTWQDVRIVRDFVRPIIQDVLERKQSLGGGDLKKDADLDQTLLDHLVVLTDGEWWFSLKVSFNWYYLRPTNNCRWDGQYATRRTWHSEDRCRARSEGCFFDTIFEWYLDCCDHNIPDVSASPPLRCFGTTQSRGTGSNRSDTAPDDRRFTGHEVFESRNPRYR